MQPYTPVTVKSCNIVGAVLGVNHSHSGDVMNNTQNLPFFRFIRFRKTGLSLITPKPHPDEIFVSDITRVDISGSMFKCLF